MDRDERSSSSREPGLLVSSLVGGAGRGQGRSNTHTVLTGIVLDGRWLKRGGSQWPPPFQEGGGREGGETVCGRASDPRQSHRHPLSPGGHVIFTR